MCQRARSRRVAALMALPATLTPFLLISLKSVHTPDALIGAAMGCAIGLAIVGLVRVRQGRN